MEEKEKKGLKNLGGETMKKRFLTMSIVMLVILAVLVAFSAPAAASWTYDGYEVKTMADGTVQGDVFVSYGDNKGAKNGRLDVSYPGPYRTNYSVPNGNSVKWARLVVGVWGGNEDNSGWLNTTLHNGTQLNYLGNVSLGECRGYPPHLPNGTNDTNPIYNQTVTSVYGTGHGCWMVAYNVTNNVSLSAWNNVTATTYTCAPSDLDGRVYGIVLVVVYENTSLAKVQYWVNEGNVNLHYNMTDAPYNYVLDNTTTWFNGTAYNSTDAKLWVEYYTGSRHEPDYLYFDPPNEVRTNKSWNVSAYKKWQLDGNTSANGSDVAYGSSTSAGWDPWGSAYGWDLHNFTATNTTNLSDLINKTANNSAFFWRGHDDNCDCWISAEFNGGTDDEGEDYLHPVLAVLILDLDYDVSVTATPDTRTVVPDEDATYTITITNTGNISDTYDLTLTPGTPAPDYYALSGSSSITLALGESGERTLTVRDSDAGTYDVTVKAVSQADATVEAEVTTTTTVE